MFNVHYSIGGSLVIIKHLILGWIMMDTDDGSMYAIESLNLEDLNKVLNNLPQAAPEELKQLIRNYADTLRKIKEDEEFRDPSEESLMERIKTQREVETNSAEFNAFLDDLIATDGSVRAHLIYLYRIIGKNRGWIVDLFPAVVNYNVIQRRSA